MQKIDNKKLEEVFRSIGVVFVSSGFLGFVLEYSFLDSLYAIFLGILLIFFGIKEDKNGN